MPFTKRNADESRDIQRIALEILAQYDDPDTAEAKAAVEDALLKAYPSISQQRLRGRLAKALRVRRGQIVREREEGDGENN